MNVYEMDACVLDMVYEDVNDTNRTEYAPIFLRSYNRAYSELQRTLYHPRVWEQVTLTGNSFDMTSLSGPCIAIEKVSRHKDFSDEVGLRPAPPLAFAVNEPNVIVAPNSGDSVWVYYETRYPELKNDTPTVEPDEADEENTPQIPEDAHIMLCLMAAHDFFMRRRRDDLAGNRMQEYYRVKGTLSHYSQSYKPCFTNMYGDYRGWK